MDFVQGGGIGSVEVRRWDGNAYELEGVEGGEGCDVDDSICAFNNGAPIDGGPWPNLPRAARPSPSCRRTPSRRSVLT